MPFYQNKGLTPPKRHIVFKYKNKLSYEELVSREGFSSIYSNLYHLNIPTAINKVGSFNKIELKSSNKTHKSRHITTHNLNSCGDAIDSRVPLLYNQDLKFMVLFFWWVYTISIVPFIIFL